MDKAAVRAAVVVVVEAMPASLPNLEVEVVPVGLRRHQARPDLEGPC